MGLTNASTRPLHPLMLLCALVLVWTLPQSAHAQKKKPRQKDTRSTPEVFAKRTGKTATQLRTDFAAVGVLRCGRYVGTASLVGDQRTIVTAAHTFRYSATELRRQICRKKRDTHFRHFKCKGRIKAGVQADAEVGFELGLERWRRDLYHRTGKKRRRPAPCTFTAWHPRAGNRLTRKTYTVDPKSVYFPEPLKSDDVIELLRKDWAIGRLTRSVEGITPILIPDRKQEEIGSKRLIQLVEDGSWEHVNATVTTVSIKFFRRGRALKRFETCKVNSAIRNRYRSGTLFFSNCFAEPGTSGSLVLQPVGSRDGLPASFKGRYMARGVIATVSRVPLAAKGQKDIGLTGGIMMERALADAVRQVIRKANPDVPLPPRRPVRHAQAK